MLCALCETDGLTCKLILLSRGIRKLKKMVRARGKDQTPVAPTPSRESSFIGVFLIPINYLSLTAAFLVVDKMKLVSPSGTSMLQYSHNFKL